MSELMNEFLQRANQVLQHIEPLLPKMAEPIDWNTVYAASWQHKGNSSFFRPIALGADIRLADLLGVDLQREQLLRNTQQFMRGFPANHALLWGSRGTGKSSIVRALLAEYAEQGLRLIEVERNELADLPLIVESLAGLPQHFIVFCDDLSFEAGEGDYRILKSVLDGSLERAPDNVLLYATSNRRHLLPEQHSDNQHWQHGDGGELHPSEAVEDKIALSDRFGLWLSFYPFNQEHYLDVVQHWIGEYARPSNLVWQFTEETAKQAISWATARGNRNGRCAAQFAKQWVGLRLLEQTV